MRGAVIGIGTIGRGHLAGYARQRELQIVALVDPLGSRGVGSIKPHFADLPCFESVEQALDSTSLDFVDICSPPNTHLDYIRLGLSRGLHVLCEKPILYSDDEFGPLYRAIGEATTVLFPAHNYQFAPGIMRVRDICQQLAFGPIEELRFHTFRNRSARGVADWIPDWRRYPAISGGGILRDHGPHSFYVMRLLAGMVPREVSCLIGDTGSGPELPEATPRVEDTAMARVRFDGGVEAWLELTWAANRRETVYRVRGRHQSVQLTDDQIIIDGGVRAIEHITSDFNDVTHSAWFVSLLGAFAAAMRENSPQVRAMAAERALQEALDVSAAYRSARQGGVWVTVPDAAEYLRSGTDRLVTSTAGAVGAEVRSA